MMETHDTYFPGQQSDERVLYVIRPHQLSMYVSLAKLYSLALVLVIFFLFLRTIHPALPIVSIFLALGISVIGSATIISMFKKHITYITDRRVVRFEAATPFATNTRALTWNEVAKVKTFPRNVFLKMFKIGTVVIHARSTYVHTHEKTRENVYTNDDLDLEYVYYYRDLGNYIDKILFLYMQNPSELAQLRPFVPKPRGQRY